MMKGYMSAIFGLKYWIAILIASLFAIIFCLFRYLLLKHKLLIVAKEEKPELFQTIQNISIHQCIKEPEEVDIDSIDLLWFKMYRNSYLLFSLLPICVVAMIISITIIVIK